jgi:diacylglycerol O-acyltransferase / wax synthase
MDRLSVTDHVTGLFQTDRNPMNIAGLLVFETPAGTREFFHERIRDHLAARLPYSSVARRLVKSPDGYDANAWFRISSETVMKLVRRPDHQPRTAQELRQHVMRRQMELIDLAEAPFEIDILDEWDEQSCALFIKVHHSCMDGVGFQLLLEFLSERGGDLPEIDVCVDQPTPSAAAWLADAERRFAANEEETANRFAYIQKAQARLEEYLTAAAPLRAAAAEMKFGAEITLERDYRVIALPLGPIKAAGRLHRAKVNDIFLAIAAGGLRQYLLARGELPEQSLVSHSVRSTRRAEDGMTGNRVASIYPVLATEVQDRLVRLERIKASMAAEKVRSALEEPMLNPPETPFGTRDRELQFADEGVLQAALGSANVVMSNVPGPGEHLYFAGYRLVANFPAPIVGPNRFLNITSRRNGDHLNLGIMVDAAKVPEIDTLAEYIENEYQAFIKVL